MRRAGLAVTVVFALLAAASSARAAADLATVTYSLAIVRSENAVTSITARLEVAGDRITRATLTPPGVNPTSVDLTADGDVFVLSQTFTTEGDLNTSFPDGTYQLTLNGSVHYDLPLARAALTSPAISAPLPAAVLVPGPVTVQFTSCSICARQFGSTQVQLEDSTGAVIDGSATTLSAPMAASGLDSIAVVDATQFPSDRSFDIRIGTEQVGVSPLDATHLGVIERGANGTTPAAHTPGDVVTQVGEPDSRWTSTVDLDPNGSFTAVVVHSVVEGDHLSGPNNDLFDLVGTFSDEDSVSFFTGAAAPAGPFCIVVQDDGTLDPDGECATPPDTSTQHLDLAALIDPSGTSSLPVGDIDMQYTSEVLPSGEIVGIALADLDGNGSLESSAPVHGKVGGYGGDVKRKLGFTFVTTAPAAKLSVKIDEKGVVTEGSLAGKTSAKGTVEGVKIKGSAPSTLPLGEAPLGWRLDVDLAKKVESASITLSNDPDHPIALRGRFDFDFVTGLGVLTLDSEGADAGVHLRIGSFQVDDLEATPPVLGGGNVTFKILGQRGRFVL